MSSFPSKKLLPDVFSFLQEGILDFLESIHNEFNLSLADAIREFTEFHTFSCNYTGFLADPKDLSVYYHLNYKPEENLAILEKVYFVSPEVLHILTYNYLLEVEGYTKSNLKKYVGKIKRAGTNREIFSYEEKFKGLTFFADYNRLDTYEAKKVLIDYSYLREKNQQLLVLKNLDNNYDYDVLKEVVVKFDLSFLKASSFFEDEKYASFKQLLPPNLIVELPITLDYELSEVPEKLKKEQLIDLSSLKMDIS